MELLEIVKNFVTADQETKNMAFYCLENPEKVAPILEKWGGDADELRKKLREVME